VLKINCFVFIYFLYLHRKQSDENVENLIKHLMSKKNTFRLIGILMILVYHLFNSIQAQVPAKLQQIVEKNEKIQSGYVKLKCVYKTDNDTTDSHTETGYFIYTPNDYKYFVIQENPDHKYLYCKSGTMLLMNFNKKNYTKYRIFEEDFDPKTCPFSSLAYFKLTTNSIVMWQNCSIFEIPPKINNKNIRYKILTPDNEMLTDQISEWEFDSNSFYWVQQEYSLIFEKIEKGYGYIEILDFQFYDYINPSILDTITFRMDDLRVKYSNQELRTQEIKDSLIRETTCDSIIQIVTSKETKWIDNKSNLSIKDSLKYMPSWKFPLLTGDTLYSDSIKSSYLFLDLWYVGCAPCIMAMKELGTIDSLFDKSLIKFVSLNVIDKDTIKIKKIINTFNIKSDIVCSYDSSLDTILSKEMSDCNGYPQLYLVDMKTKQVIWQSCGYYKGFTKEIEAILKKEE
jgi:hypothetical protein